MNNIITKEDVVSLAETLLIEDDSRHLNDLEYGNNQALYHLMDGLDDIPSRDDLVSRSDIISELRKYFNAGYDEDRWWNSTHVLAAIASA